MDRNDQVYDTEKETRNTHRQFDNDIKGILSFYCQIDSVDHENLSGICAAADGTQEPLDGVSTLLPLTSQTYHFP